MGSISIGEGPKETGARKRVDNGKQTINRVVENVPYECYRTQITSLGIGKAVTGGFRISRLGVILLKMAGFEPPVSTKDNPDWQAIVRRGLRNREICSWEKRHQHMGVYEGRRRLRSGLVSAKSHSSSTSRDRLAEALSIG